MVKRKEMAKRKVEVSLRGQSFSVRSDRDEATIHAIASFVGHKFEEVGRQASRLSPHELALLVALNIAEDLFDAEDHARGLRHEMKERSQRILARIDGALQTVPKQPTTEQKDQTTSDDKAATFLTQGVTVESPNL